MPSKTQIVNEAYARIGVTRTIPNIETDRSAEALAALLHFDSQRDYTLRAFPWPFATSYETLGLVGGSLTTAVNNDWQYSYRYPAECLFARRIVTELGRKETKPPPFRIARDSQGKLIYTDQQDAELEFTCRITDAEEFDPLFVSAFAWQLAKVLAPGRSRIKGIVETCIKMFDDDISRARAVALNEGQQTEEYEGDLMASRA